MTASTLILIGIVIIVMVTLLYPVFVKSRNVNPTEKSDTKPEWMRETPPDVTVQATLADNEGVAVFDHDEGEKLAAPFAEQIEDVMRARLQADPYFEQFKVDVVTGENGGLEVWVNGEKYASADALPDERLKQALKDAIKQWYK